MVVTENGVAEVPLSREVLQAPPSELSRAVDQLAWTLRQVPGIERVRITVGGTPVPLPGGGIDAPVTSGAEFDAAGPAVPSSGGCVVAGWSTSPRPASRWRAPLGKARVLACAPSP